MARVRWRLYYHVVWTTKRRAPWLVPEIRPRILGAIRDKLVELGCSIRSVNCVSDHVHLCGEIPPSLAISDAIGAAKGASSHLANHQLHLDEHFAWQEGFGVMTLSARDVARVTRYIHGQEQHHREGTLNELLETTEEA